MSLCFVLLHCLLMFGRCGLLLLVRFGEEGVRWEIQACMYD
jgi:hypothetical protein